MKENQFEHQPTTDTRIEREKKYPHTKNMMSRFAVAALATVVGGLGGNDKKIDSLSPVENSSNTPGFVDTSIEGVPDGVDINNNSDNVA